MCAKLPHVRSMVDDIHAIYARASYNGVYEGETQLAERRVAPPIGNPLRWHWKPSVVPFGPVGLLLCNAYFHAIDVDSDFKLHMHKETPFSIF